MFFPRERAHALVRSIREHVRARGRAIVNVLTEGTTFMGMVDGDNYYLFEPNELERYFEGWNILSPTPQTFPAPGEHPQGVLDGGRREALSTPRMVPGQVCPDRGGSHPGHSWT